MKLKIIVYALPLLLVIHFAPVTAQTTTARNSTLVSNDSNDNTAQIDSLVRIFTGQSVEEQKKEKSDKAEADCLQREADQSASELRIVQKKEKQVLKSRNDAGKQARKAEQAKQ